MAGRTRGEADADMRAAVEQLLSDCLATLCLPKWPAAALILIRFISTATGLRGLGSNDSFLRHMAIDLLSSLAARLSATFAAAESAAGKMKVLLQREWCL